MGNLFNMDSPVMRFLSLLCDLMILNFLCLICCLPIVTAGASVTALYSVTLKMVRGEESYIFKGFFKAFKENFKISTIIWVILALIGALIFVDYQAAAAMPGKLQTVFKMMIGVLITFYAMTLTYIFPYIARFENTIFNTVKNSILISILNLPNTILLLSIPVGTAFITLYNGTTMMYGSLFWILVGFSTIAYCNSVILRKVFVKYEPTEDSEMQAEEKISEDNTIE